MLINSPAQVEVYRMGERQELCDVRAPYSWSFLRQAQNAVDAVRGTAVPLCTIADGLEQLRLTEAIYREALQA
jgi:predicted dehydrogenase